MPLTRCREGRDRGETRSASRETCQNRVRKRADGVIRDRNALLCHGTGARFFGRDAPFAI